MSGQGISWYCWWRLWSFQPHSVSASTNFTAIAKPTCLAQCRQRPRSGEARLLQRGARLGRPLARLFTTDRQIASIVSATGRPRERPQFGSVRADRGMTARYPSVTRSGRHTQDMVRPPASSGAASGRATARWVYGRSCRKRGRLQRASRVGRGAPAAQRVEQATPSGEKLGSGMSSTATSRASRGRGVHSRRCGCRSGHQSRQQGVARRVRRGGCAAVASWPQVLRSR